MHSDMRGSFETYLLRIIRSRGGMFGYELLSMAGNDFSSEDVPEIFLKGRLFGDENDVIITENDIRLSIYSLTEKRRVIVKRCYTPHGLKFFIYANTHPKNNPKITYVLKIVKLYLKNRKRSKKYWNAVQDRKFTLSRCFYKHLVRENMAYVSSEGSVECGGLCSCCGNWVSSEKISTLKYDLFNDKIVYLNHSGLSSITSRGYNVIPR